jgi:hypothetical protein
MPETTPRILVPGTGNSRHYHCSAIRIDNTDGNESATFVMDERHSATDTVAVPKLHMKTLTFADALQDEQKAPHVLAVYEAMKALALIEVQEQATEVQARLDAAAQQEPQS